MWTKRLNPDCLPDDFSPEEVREDLGDLGLLQVYDRVCFIPDLNDNELCLMMS